MTNAAAPAAAIGPDDLFCPECGYNLRGIDAIDRCPECGHALDRARLTASNLPWTHRAEIGVARAYLRTVALVIRHPTRAGAEVSRPVSHDDAQKFRRATVRIAMIGPLALLAWGCVLAFQDRTPDFTSGASAAVRIGWALQILLAPVLIVAAYAFLLAASSAASYFFHAKWLPTERQNRAVAVSYYACAPLALTPLSIASIVAAGIASRVLDGGDVLLAAFVVLMLAIAPTVQAFASITAPLRMLQRATHCGPGRAVALLTLLPLMWALLAAIIAIGIPAAYLFVAIVIMSLIA